MTVRSKKKILYCVLNWGLGHATRSIPVIKTLLEEGHEILLASDGQSLSYLQVALPSLRTFELPSYDVTYDAASIIGIGLKNRKNILRAVRNERKSVASLIEAEDIDVVISDNRYGCSHADVPSILITHQLQFKSYSSLINNLLGRVVSRWIKPFDQIWVPDSPDRQLSGELSETNDERVRYIGWLSNLEKERSEIKYAIACILSGPEPQRTLLEEKVMRQLSELPVPSVIVRGAGACEEARLEGNLTIYDTLQSEEIDDIVNASDVVLGRSGYSSLMDWRVLGKRAILVPTPAQPEQLYLAGRMMSYPWFAVQSQDDLDIEHAFAALKKVKAPEPEEPGENLLRSAIRGIARAVQPL